MDVTAVCRQVEDGITDDLSGSVICDVPSPIDPNNLCSELDQFLIARKNMVFISPLPDRVHVIVLCKQEEISDKTIMPAFPQSLLQIPACSVVGSAKLGDGNCGMRVPQEPRVQC